MKLGVFCDGISRDLTYSLDVMNEFDLKYAELQFVGDIELVEHSEQEISSIKVLLERQHTLVSCSSRYIFAGMASVNEPGGT